MNKPLTLDDALGIVLGKEKKTLSEKTKQFNEKTAATFAKDYAAVLQAPSDINEKNRKKTEKQNKGKKQSSSGHVRYSMPATDKFSQSIYFFVGGSCDHVRTIDAVLLNPTRETEDLFEEFVDSIYAKKFKNPSGEYSVNKSECGLDLKIRSYQEKGVAFNKIASAAQESKEIRLEKSLVTSAPEDGSIESRLGGIKAYFLKQQFYRIAMVKSDVKCNK